MTTIAWTAGSAAAAATALSIASHTAALSALTGGLSMARTATPSESSAWTNSGI